MNLEESIQIIDLEKRSYKDSLDIQLDLVEKRKKDEVKDTLILVEHPPTITLGSDDKWNVVHASDEEIAKLGVALHKRNNGNWASRGGGAAYLGPGQLIGYTILDITEYGPLNFLRKLEEVMIRTAKDFDIDVRRVEKMNPSTDKLYRATWYQKDGKNYVLCTKGIGIKTEKERLISHHGFALNVNDGKNFYGLIDPCGFSKKEIEPITMQSILGREINLKYVKESVVKNFGEVFGRVIEYGICV